MRDAPTPIELQRARGRAEVAVSRRDGGVRLDRLFQQGCAKALLPRPGGPAPEVVLINTAGGVTGGDRIDWRLAAGAGAALVATTQAAERVYRSAGGAARIATRLTLGAGARLDWLPQETILFDGARLDRRLEVEMAADARLLALETLVLGRAAMGETVATGAVSDQWRIRRGGRLVHAEALRLDGDLAAATAGAATLGRRAGAGDAGRRRAGRRASRRRAGARRARRGHRGGQRQGRGRSRRAHARGRGAGLARRADPLSDGVPGRAAAARLDELRGAMNLTPREKDKLLVSVAAMVARGRLARGVRLNHPEAIALITDFVVEGARDGRSVAELMEAGAHVVAASQCMEGCRR